MILGMSLTAVLYFKIENRDSTSTVEKSAFP